MTKSELIEKLTNKQNYIPVALVESTVKQIIDHMINILATDKRIEIRGFGSFSLHHRKARTGRNPKTGQSVQLQEKSVPHFKPGKELRDLVNQSKTNGVPLPPKE